MKEYLLALTVDEKIICNSRTRKWEISNSVMVTVKSKAKEEVMKWTSTAHGKEVIVKDKVENLTTFSPYDLATKIECTEYLESFWYKKCKSQET